MSRVQYAGTLAVLILQSLVIVSLINADILWRERLAFVGAIEATILFLLFSSYSGRFVMLAVTAFLVLLGNFAATPVISTKPQFMTLLPHIDRQVRVVGDIMPGFSGIQRITTDQKGFRVTKPVDYSAKEGLRVFAIGGSTTEQIYLDDHKTWAAVLERGLEQQLNRPVEVINTGVSGLRAEHHYATLLEIEKYSPDIVVFLMGINDWNAHVVEEEFGAVWRNPFDLFLSPLFQGLRSIRNLTLSGKKPNIEPPVQMEDGAYYAAQHNSLNREDKRASRIGDVADQYKFWVDRIGQVCRRDRIYCIFVDQPTAYRPDISPDLKQRLWMTPPNQQWTLSMEEQIRIAGVYNRWLMAAAKDLGVSACEIASQVPATTAYFYDDCHFNEGGALRVGHLIQACVVDGVGDRYEPISGR